MITPIIIYNDKILKRLSIFINIGGITIYPFIILKEKNKKQGVNKLVVHESIHIKQAEELGLCKVVEGADWNLEIGLITELSTYVPNACCPIPISSVFLALRNLAIP